MCLKEFVFTRNLGAETFDTYDSHLLVCNPQVMGARPCGLIFHHEIRHLIVDATRQVYDRGLAVGLHWMGIIWWAASIFRPIASEKIMIRLCKCYEIFLP